MEKEQNNQREEFVRDEDTKIQFLRNFFMRVFNDSIQWIKIKKRVDIMQLVNVFFTHGRPMNTGWNKIYINFDGGCKNPSAISPFTIKLLNFLYIL